MGKDIYTGWRDPCPGEAIHMMAVKNRLPELAKEPWNSFYDSKIYLGVLCRQLERSIDAKCWYRRGEERAKVIKQVGEDWAIVDERYTASRESYTQLNDLAEEDLMQNNNLDTEVQKAAKEAKNWMECIQDDVADLKKRAQKITKA